MNNRWRQFIKRFHPEGIPWPGSVLYNAISGTAIFLQHYELVAKDMAGYGTVSCILDIGTGPGQLLLAMRRVMPDAMIVGIDISPAMVEQAQRNIAGCRRDPGIAVDIANANALPFKDETFDRIISTGSFHHWKDPIGALYELYRVLKTGGHALIYDLVRDMPRDVRRDIYSRFGGFRFGLLWLHSLEEPFLNAGEMEALGKKAGFLIEETKFTGAFCCIVLKKTGVQGKK